ncbi:MAG: META domain-containing protein [Pseudomonadota bacterium]
MLHRSPTAALCVAAGLVLAACDASPPEPEKPPITKLGDTPWRLAMLDGEAVGSVEFVLNISGGFISGTGPCNTISADYQGQAPDFVIGTLITTRAVCDRLGFERKVVAALANATRAMIADERLTITGLDSPEMTFVPAG